MNRMSIKLKITLWYSLVMVIVATVVLFALTSMSKEMVNREMAGRLSKVVTDMSRRVVGPGGQIHHMPPFMFFEQGVQLALYDETYHLLSEQSPFGITQEFDFEHNCLRKKVYNGNAYYVFDRKIRAPGAQEAFWIKGVASVDAESYALNSIVRNNAILTAILIVVAALGGYFIISRALVPVNVISKTAKEISRSRDLSRRINIGRGSDEIYALANTFDEMLEKIEQTFEREKQFTSDASHELRTPTAVILSECEYMTECAEQVEDFKESAASVKRQAEKMSKLIAELLTISKMDQNTLPINFEETDISELLSFVCDEQEEIHDGAIILEKQIPPGVVAQADRFLLARLFINLIANAYQYSKETGTIVVNLSEDEEHVTISVLDHGIGIAPENIPKIWERFYQVEKSRTARETGSMGLGLSMVKWIAESHGGHLNVQSVPGEGSEFVFVLPKIVG